jgi:hypothetical protein
LDRLTKNRKTSLLSSHAQVHTHIFFSMLRRKADLADLTFGFKNFKTEAELRAMDFQTFQQRRKDVNVTLAMLRKARKRGMINPGVYSRLKAEKKMIIKIMEEKHWQPA